MIRSRGSVPIAASMSAYRAICSESFLGFEAVMRVLSFLYFHNNGNIETSRLFFVLVKRWLEELSRDWLGFGGGGSIWLRCWPQERESRGQVLRPRLVAS